MERFFQAAAVVLIASAAVFFFLGNIDGVFISIVLGCLSYFLSVRTQVKARLAEREEMRALEEASRAEAEAAPETSAAEKDLA